MAIPVGQPTGQNPAYRPTHRLHRPRVDVPEHDLDRRARERRHYGDGMIIESPDQLPRVPLADIPMTRDGTIAFQAENAMAAIAAAWACGLEWSVVARAAASFQSDVKSVPGRFNLLAYRGATVIVDYGHNPDAMRALVRAVEAMPLGAGARRSVVISGAGDRRDEDIRGQTRILGAAFDDAVLFEDACQRGRAAGEVLALLREGLRDAAKTQSVVELRGEFTAIDHALDRLRAGDLCLVFVDQVQEGIAHIQARIARG